MLAIACAVPLTVGTLLSVVIGGWKQFSANADYAFPDDGKSELYADRTVMLIVPHLG